MSASVSLLDWLMNLLKDPAAKAAFTQDPQGYLQSCGLEHLSAEDVHDAIVLAGDHQSADFSRHYDHTAPTHLAPPPPVHPAPGEDAHEAAVRYLNTYITNNYIDQHDTIVDNSVNQQIDNRGGHFDQTIDNHPVVASGAGAVAAGGDIDHSTVTTGHDNVVGNDNNVVHGDHDTTAFGSGSAANLSNVNVDHGGAVAVGGNAAGNSQDSHNELNNFGKGSINTADHGSTASQAVSATHTDSHNDSSTHVDNHSTTDNHSVVDTNSHNDTDTTTTLDSHNDTHTELASHNTSSVDSHDTSHVLADNHFHA
ncbi:IniB N-terminal domain-containing protein [Pseudonocardia acidicola]|uniref:IniB N-terminal domain-containing protein n=1 Tax=Pseudonocardia acidicola TaxID=2724939 RepID=UPI001B7CDF77|nr:IniB N-terminal domain-containing protein [Pseudonocardia acidicola]